MTTNDLLAPTIHDIDSRLHELVSSINILTAVSPLNYREQKQIFFNINTPENPSLFIAVMI
jgi:hypothetical protein